MLFDNSLNSLFSTPLSISPVRTFHKVEVEKPLPNDLGSQNLGLEACKCPSGIRKPDTVVVHLTASYVFGMAYTIQHFLYSSLKRTYSMGKCTSAL